ncbi:hypothetical protein CSO01_02410 [Cellulomonas soli]|uniref:Uncharacterized protein n=1 Tax=Cellulomonas soli TaxID=931535 RepID=A0A512P8J4_9CELL|nr:hypothetical protein CSO01_02410 [Cellulomonas soli]
MRPATVTLPDVLTVPPCSQPAIVLGPLTVIVPGVCTSSVAPFEVVVAPEKRTAPAAAEPVSAGLRGESS